MVTSVEERLVRIEEALRSLGMPQIALEDSLGGHVHPIPRPVVSSSLIPDTTNVPMLWEVTSDPPELWLTDQNGKRKLISGIGGDPFVHNLLSLIRSEEHTSAL